MADSTAERALADTARPTLDDVRRMSGWAPPLGVISIYLHFDPADRGGRWRTELRNGLAAVLESSRDLDHDTRTAVRATAQRITARFEDREARGLPRGEIGFVEVAAAPGQERWWATHAEPPLTSVRFEDRPVIAPLIGMISKAAPRGVALVSAERVRLLEWADGRTEEIESWELEIFSGDWRERKAQRVADPARGQAISAAGHEQFNERLNENRNRFLGESQRLALQAAAQRGWDEILAIGPSPHLGAFCEGGPSAPRIIRAAEHDLVSTPTGQLSEPIAEAFRKLERERDRQLAQRVLEEAGGGARGSLGSQETQEALDQGRVEHLVVDGGLMPPAREEDGGGNRGTDLEPLVRRALQSGAAVTMLTDEAADLISGAGGVVALLRY